MLCKQNIIVYPIRLNHFLANLTFRGCNCARHWTFGPCVIKGGKGITHPTQCVLQEFLFISVLTTATKHMRSCSWIGGPTSNNLPTDITDHKPKMVIEVHHWATCCEYSLSQFDLNKSRTKHQYSLTLFLSDTSSRHI